MIKKLLSLTVVALMVAQVGFSAGKENMVITKTGSVAFFSSTPLEDIEATNNAVNSYINTQTGEVAYSVTVKAFSFKKALMQEHFNDNYMESDKYPKSTFKGKIVNLDKINFNKDGKYNADIEGDLTIHGVTKPVKTKGELEVKGGNVKAVSKIPVKPTDFEINIPAGVKGKIAETLEVKINMDYKKN